MKEQPIKFAVPKVKRYYRLDWQYAVDLYNLTILRFLSLFLFFIPVLVDVQKVVSLSIPPGLWIASVLFGIASLIIYVFCPKLIREYRDFGQYRARYHSHRWIVWEFYNTLGWEAIVQETIAKGISVEFSKFPNGEIKNQLKRVFEEDQTEDRILMYRPQNINRDIYLPIRLQDRKIILFLEEDDKKLPEKEKELFWILYSQAAKQEVEARYIYWILISTSGLVFFLTLFNIFSKIVLN
jgi:hypothetical protein